MLAILSDSYLKDFRISTQVEGGTLSLNPHSDRKLKVYNLAKGSCTWKELINNKTILHSWANSRPEITLIHLGACDIINKQFVIEDIGKVARGFTTYIEQSVETLVQFAKQQISDFDRWESYHRFVVVQLPDWGNYQAFKGSLEPELYKQVRRLVNHQLKQNRGALFGKRNVIIVSPNTQYPQMKGVHYDDKTQAEYIEQIFEVVKKISCQSCRPKKDTPAKQIAALRDPGCGAKQATI